jgi:hypothetical protein
MITVNSQLTSPISFTLTRSPITRINLPCYEREGLVGVLVRCPALAHLDLSGKNCIDECLHDDAEPLGIRESHAGALALAQRWLTSISASNQSDAEAGILAETLAHYSSLLAQCPALLHLDLGRNLNFWLVDIALSSDERAMSTSLIGYPADFRISRLRLRFLAG